LGAGTLKVDEEEFHKLLKYTMNKKKAKVEVSQYGLKCSLTGSKKTAVFDVAPGQVVRSDIYRKNGKIVEAKTVAIVMRSTTQGHPYELHVLGCNTITEAMQLNEIARSMVRVISLIRGPASDSRSVCESIPEEDFETEA